MTADYLIGGSPCPDILLTRGLSYRWTQLMLQLTEGYQKAGCLVTKEMLVAWRFKMGAGSSQVLQQLGIFERPSSNMLLQQLSVVLFRRKSCTRAIFYCEGHISLYFILELYSLISCFSIKFELLQTWVPSTFSRLCSLICLDHQFILNHSWCSKLYLLFPFPHSFCMKVMLLMLIYNFVCESLYNFIMCK